MIDSERPLSTTCSHSRRRILILAGPRSGQARRTKVCVGLLELLGGRPDNRLWSWWDGVFSRSRSTNAQASRGDAPILPTVLPN